MSRALLLGAGLVARPLIKYLLDEEIGPTIASRARSAAEALLDGHPGGAAVTWTSDDTAALHRLFAAHDVTISLLPAAASAKRIMVEGEIIERGGQIPIQPASYNPILDEPATMQIALVEHSETL